MHLTYAGIITPRAAPGQIARCVAPYLYRYYYSVIGVLQPPSIVLHLTYTGIITLGVQAIYENPYQSCTLPMQVSLLSVINAVRIQIFVAPYLPRYPKAKLPRVSLFFCHSTIPMTGSLQFRPCYAMLSPENQAPHPWGFSFAAMPQEGKGAKR